MPDLTPKARRAAIFYLTDSVSTTEGLADKLGVTLIDAEQTEVTLVADGLLSRSPGFYQNPRFFLTDNGLAYLSLVSAKGPIDPQRALDAIKAQPWGDFYAGTRLQVYHALMTLVQQGYVTTDDGGGSFALVAEA